MSQPCEASSGTICLVSSNARITMASGLAASAPETSDENVVWPAGNSSPSPLPPYTISPPAASTVSWTALRRPVP